MILLNVFISESKFCDIYSFQLFLIKDNFNSKVYDLRNKKIALVERFTELNATLKNIHRELDPTQRKYLPEVPKFDEKLEFPDKRIKVGCFVL
jgi:hypothetical protein